jgi:hypothetical protein
MSVRRRRKRILRQSAKSVKKRNNIGYILPAVIGTAPEREGAVPITAGILSDICAVCPGFHNADLFTSKIESRR